MVDLLAAAVSTTDEEHAVLPHKRFSLFLTPSETDFAFLEAMMRELGATCAASPFEPHVTVYSGSLTDPGLLQRAVTVATVGMAPFFLKITGIGCSTEYFKSLYVEFEESAVVRGIHDRLKRELGEDSGYVLIPHLSLLYCDMPLAGKEAMARRIDLDREEILFGRVKVVAPQNLREEWRDVDGWQTLFSMKLGDVD